MGINKRICFMSAQLQWCFSLHREGKRNQARVLPRAFCIHKKLFARTIPVVILLFAVPSCISYKSKALGKIKRKRAHFTFRCWEMLKACLDSLISLAPLWAGSWTR